MTETIEPEEDGSLLFNSETFAYDPKPIGLVSFVPEETSDLEIRLSDALGQDLLEAARQGDEIAGENEAFQDFLRGLVLVGEQTHSSAVVGFASALGDSSAIAMRLHYTINEDDVTVENHYDFWPSVHSFSHIVGKRNPPLDELKETHSMISSALTNEVVYIQSGAGLAVRIDVPAAYRVFYGREFPVILNASLYIVPIADTYRDETPLVWPLDLYVANENNKRRTPLLGQDSSRVSAIPIVDSEFERGTHYRFDVTTFVQQEINAGYHTGRGLLLVPARSVNASTVDRVVLGSGQHPEYHALLRVVYTTF